MTDLEFNDIIAFFLEALLEKGELIFMEQIPGHEDGTDMIYQLTGNLYGLPQGPRHAQQLLKRVMKSQGFKELASDMSTYINKNEKDERRAIAVIHVDDAVCAGPAKSISTARKALESRFKLVTTKEPEFMLGMQVIRSRKHRWLKIHQLDYVKKMLKKWNIQRTILLASS